MNKKQLVMLLAGLPLSIWANLLTEIEKRGTLNVGILDNLPPFSWVDSNGTYQGIDIEIAKQLSKKLFGDENKISFTPLQLRDRIPALKTGQVDIVIGGFTATANRSREVDFAEPYMKSSLSLLSKSPISSLNDLNDKTVVVANGSSNERYLKDKHPKVKLYLSESESEAFEDLKNGKGEVLSSEDSILWNWANQNPEYHVSPVTLGQPEYIAPAVNNGEEELLAWVNQQMKELKTNGKLSEIYQNLLGSKYTPKQLNSMMGN